VNRTRNYSLFSICVGVTTLVGPMASGFGIDGMGHRAACLLLAGFPTVAVIALVLVPSLRSRPLPSEKSHRERGVADLLANAPLRRVLIATALLETGVEVFNFLMPIYGHSIGLSASQIGIVMGAYGLAVLVVRTVLTALVRRSGEVRVFAYALAVGGAACAALPLTTDFALLVTLSFVLGLGLGCGSPLSMTLCYSRAPAARAGEAIGLRQAVSKGIESILPVIFGLASAALGAVPVYWFSALMLGLGAWVMRADQSSKGRPT